MSEQELISLFESNPSASRTIRFSKYELFIYKINYPTDNCNVSIWDKLKNKHIYPATNPYFKNQKWTDYFNPTLEQLLEGWVPGPYSDAEVNITIVVEIFNFLTRLDKLNAFED